MTENRRTKLITFVSSQRRSEIIQDVINAEENFILQNEIIVENNVSIKNVLKTMKTQTVDIVIIDLKAIKEKNITEEMQSYRAQRPETRIIVFLESIHVVGDANIKDLVSLGIYDLIPYRENIENEKTELQEYIFNPATYTKVIKYHTFDTLYDGEGGVGTGTQKNIYTPVNNSRIIIASLYSGAGASFITMNMAKMLSNSNITVGVAEPPIRPPYIYHALDLDRRINELKERNRDDEDKPARALFKSFPHTIATSSRKRVNYQAPIYNMDELITYYVTSPYEDKNITKTWTSDNMISLNNVASNQTITLFDIGNQLLNPCYNEILTHMTKIYVILEPMIGKIMTAESELKEIVNMMRNGLPIEFVFNKTTSLSELNYNRNFKEIRTVGKSELIIPYISPKEVQKCHNTGRYVIDVAESGEELRRGLITMAEQFVQKDLLYKIRNEENVQIEKLKEILSKAWEILKSIYKGIRDAKKRRTY